MKRDTLGHRLTRACTPVAASDNRMLEVRARLVDTLNIGFLAYDRAVEQGITLHDEQTESSVW